jgi:hypothetical protein
MNTLISPSNTANAINAFVKNITDKQTQKDVKTLLQECCVPTWTYQSTTCDWNPSDGGTYGVVFQNSVVTFKAGANKSATVVLSTPGFSGGAWQHITFDSEGVWTGDIYSSWETGDSAYPVTIQILIDGSRVLSASTTYDLTGLSQCD